jgi:hypothetical protein
MTENPLEPNRGTGSLVQAPLEVIRQLENEPVLLGGMGASALLAILAIFAPSGAQIYAWIIAGLMMTLCLTRAFLSGPHKHRSDADPGGDLIADDGVNRFETGSAKIDGDVTVEARRRNVWRSRRGTRIKGGLAMRAGLPAPSSDEAERSKDSAGPGNEGSLCRLVTICSSAVRPSSALH